MVQSLVEVFYWYFIVQYVVGLGYVVWLLEVVLWCFYYFDSFEEVVLRVVNLGDDVDIIVVIVGQVVGVYYGVGGIFVWWVSQLVMKDEIEWLVDCLYEERFVFFYV